MRANRFFLLLAAQAIVLSSTQATAREINLHCNFGIIQKNYRVELDSSVATDLETGESLRAEITYQWIKVYTKSGVTPPVEIINRITGASHLEWLVHVDDPEMGFRVFSGHCTTARVIP
jgi:hypothetical protein